MNIAELSLKANKIDDEQVESILTALELGNEITDKQYFILSEVVSVYRGFRRLRA